MPFIDTDFLFLLESSFIIIPAVIFLQLIFMKHHIHSLFAEKLSIDIPKEKTNPIFDGPYFFHYTVAWLTKSVRKKMQDDEDEQHIIPFLY